MLLQILPYGEDERHPDRLIFKFDYSFHYTFRYVNYEIEKTIKAVTPQAIKKNQLNRNEIAQIYYKIKKGDRLLAVLPGISREEIFFLLPDSFRNKLTFVISPQGALLQEKEACVKINYRFQPSAYIDPSISREERKILCTDIKLGKIRLVYINPYNLNMKQFRDKLKLTLKDIPVQNVILDAAHCLSAWGFDFKPSYQKVPEFINWLKIENPELTLLALTPNTNPFVTRDIMRELGLMKGAIQFSNSLYRSNISFQVVTVRNQEEKSSAFEHSLLKDIPTALNHSDLISIFKNHDGHPAAFCVYADVLCEQGADFFLTKTQKILTDLNVFDVKEYKASQPKLKFQIKNPVLWPKYIYSYFMSSNREDRNERNMRDIPGPLITTRIPDMDVNTDAIRFVIHTAMTDSIEHWFREISRAGKDGERAHCLQIIDMPLDECELDMQTRMTDIPLCSQYDACRFGKDQLCDFGKQHIDIKKNAPNIIQHIIHTLWVFDRLLSGLKDQEKPIKVDATSENANDTELALYYLTVLGIIQGYQIEFHDETLSFEIEGFSELIDPDYVIHSLLQFLRKNDISSRSKFEKMTVEEIKQATGEIYRYRERFVSKLEKEIENAIKLNDILNFSSNRTIFQTLSDCLLILLSFFSENVAAMRYRMLWNIKEFIRNDSCRHAELLKHFQAIKQDWKCNCCDVCLPKLNFLYGAKNQLPDKTDDAILKQKELEDWITNDTIDFNIESARQYISELTSGEVSVNLSDVYIRASYLLEKSPRNIKALYIAREMAPNPLKGKASLDLMKIAAQDLNFPIVKQLYQTSPNLPHIRQAQFDVLDDTYGPCHSFEGIKWLFTEAISLSLDHSKIECLGASVLAQTLKQFNLSTLLSKLALLTEEF